MSQLGPLVMLEPFLDGASIVQPLPSAHSWNGKKWCNTHHMESVMSLLVAQHLGCAVSDPDKGAWVLQQAHDICFWLLSVTLVV